MNDRNLQDIGRRAAESIADMVAALECDYDRISELEAGEELTLDEQTELADLNKAAGDCASREDAEQRIHEDPLSLELSGTWALGDKPVADKAILLLGTGGPAVRLIVELDDGEAHRAYLQVQDWGTPWTDYIVSAPCTARVLLAYARCFYYGEG
jgi:hypothetical protein